jgi:hypothetical protein
MPRREPDTEPTIDEAKTLIERMRPRDRAKLRPWILARFDVSGNLERAVAERERARHDD